MEFRFAPALHFEGTGKEDDAFIDARVEQVRSSIASLIAEGKAQQASA
jgi:hypothetical protein